MVTWKSSPPAFRTPIRYFLLASDALWVTSNDLGVYAEKKVRRIWRAWLREQFLGDDMIVTSRLSANQLDRDAASPAARYLVMELNTAKSPSGDWAKVLTAGVFATWAMAGTESSSAASHIICFIFFIRASFLQNSSRISTIVSMNVKLLTVGKTDVSWVKEGLDLYASRLRHYVPFTVEEIPELKKVSALSEEQIKQKEGELILVKTAPQDTVVLLDEHGLQMRSMEFASWLEKQLSSGAKGIVFVIGGAYGFSEEVYARASAKISLSRMTFSHQMVRAIFAEQLYCACTILKGEPYHHE